MSLYNTKKVLIPCVVELSYASKIKDLISKWTEIFTKFSLLIPNILIHKKRKYSKACYKIICVKNKKEISTNDVAS